jgi:RNA polymerase subunit RPABC4/transcription elongation factor Spt4
VRSAAVLPRDGGDVGLQRLACPRMQQAPGEAVQKVCPACSTVAFTHAPRCPWCGANYRRRLWPALLAVAVVQTAIVLGGVALMLVAAGDELDRRLNRSVQSVERDIDASLGRIERSVRAELDRRLPPVP